VGFFRAATLRAHGVKSMPWLPGEFQRGDTFMNDQDLALVMTIIFLLKDEYPNSVHVQRVYEQSLKFIHQGRQTPG
jgi:hypothetical protein